MRLYPAIDILDNRAVRLLHGRRDKVTEYGDPVELAKKWQAAGAEILHTVDLNGAFDTSDVNGSTISKIIKSLDIPVQLGGGIKSFERVKFCIEQLGASYVVLGTAAVLNPDIMQRACEKYGEKIVCGIDVKDGLVAVKGWVEVSNITAKTLADRVKKMGVKTVVFTDISRDGALTGVNVEATAHLQNASGMNIIASGGVRGLDDLKALKAKGAFGAIIGKALYTGDIDLREALTSVTAGKRDA